MTMNIRPYATALSMLGLVGCANMPGHRADQPHVDPADVFAQAPDGASRTIKIGPNPAVSEVFKNAPDQQPGVYTTDHATYVADDVNKNQFSSPVGDYVQGFADAMVYGQGYISNAQLLDNSSRLGKRTYRLVVTKVGEVTADVAGTAYKGIEFSVAETIAGGGTFTYESVYGLDHQGKLAVELGRDNINGSFYSRTTLDLKGLDLVKAGESTPALNVTPISSAQPTTGVSGLGLMRKALAQNPGLT